jgi:hypothetical protein
LEFRLDIWCHGWNLSFPREGQSLCHIGKTESQTVYRTNKQSVIWLQILYTGNTCILENQWHFILQSIVFTNEIGFYTVSQNIYSYFNGRHYTLLSTLKKINFYFNIWQSVWSGEMCSCHLISTHHTPQGTWLWCIIIQYITPL